MRQWTFHVAVKLKKFPHEVEALPITEFEELIAWFLLVAKAEEEASNKHKTGRTGGQTPKSKRKKLEE